MNRACVMEGHVEWNGDLSSPRLMSLGEVDRLIADLWQVRNVDRTRK